MQHSDTFVNANGMAPAALIKPIDSESFSPRMFLRAQMPAVCKSPFTRMQSLVDTGTPRNGFCSASSSTNIFPLRIRASASAASLRAASKQLSTTQLNVGLISLIRSMNAWTTATLVIYEKDDQRGQ